MRAFAGTLDNTIRYSERRLSASFNHIAILGVLLTKFLLEESLLLHRIGRWSVSFRLFSEGIEAQ